MVAVYTFILGSLYLLISLGFSLICGVLRIFHLGYGAIFVVAAYVTWMFMKEFGLSLIPSVILMLIFQLIFILATYYGIIKRYIEREEYLLISLLLIALIVEEAANYKYPIIVGVDIPSTIIPGVLKIGGATIPYQMLIAALVGIIFTAIFVIFFLKSRIGLVMRCVSQNVRDSLLLGVNVERIYVYALLLAVIPPTICIIIIAPVWAIDPFLGWPLFTTAILISIMGGLGNLKGSIMASYIVGFIHSYTSLLLNPRFTGLTTLVIVVLLLIFRPEGIARSESLW